MANIALQTLNKTAVIKFVRQINTASTKLINVEVNDKSGFARLTLQRPPVNSLNLELLRDISSTLAQLEKEKSRGVVLTSSSSSVFSAGLDIMEMYKPNQDRLKEFWTALQDMWIKLYGTSLPTVAVINGHAPAGGCLLSLCCEYRIMVNNFTIGLNETQLGLIPPEWFISSMVNTVGSRQAEMAVIFGRLFKTNEALEIGLIDEAASSKEEAIVKAENFLQKFLKISPVARALTKQSIRKDIINNMIKNRDHDLNTFVSTVNNEAVQQGLGRYLESLKKRSATS